MKPGPAGSAEDPAGPGIYDITYYVYYLYCAFYMYYTYCMINAYYTYYMIYMYYT